MRTSVNKGTQWILSISSSWLHPLELAVGKEVVRNQKRKFPYPFLRTTGPNTAALKRRDLTVSHNPGVLVKMTYFFTAMLSKPVPTLIAIAVDI